MHVALLLVLATACQPTPSAGPPADTAAAHDDGAQDDDGSTGDSDGATHDDTGDGLVQPGALDALALPAAAPVSETHFATAGTCQDCHANAPGAEALRDDAGRPVGNFDLWQGTMMANASRDPLWRAVVSAEIETTPAAGPALEAKCMRCHAPMASEDAALHGEEVSLADLSADTERGHLARDGVSCTLCHQVEDIDLGTEASFSGGWTVIGDGTIYGPYADPFAQPMVAHTGLEPVQGEHLLDSALCATCHTLHTATLSADASPTGTELPEQTPYLEWQLSDFAGDTSCQDCHLPTVDEDGAPFATAIARRPNGTDFPDLVEREPFGRHVMVGGNTLIPAMLRDHAAALGVQAPPEAFDATIARARALLATSTATLAVRDAGIEDGRIAFEVALVNLAGHRYPTGIPIRRAWLHVVVRDADGQVVLESGAWDDQGRLVADDGAPLASEAPGGPVEPHRDEVEHPDQVPVYEAVMAGVDGQPTFRLLRGASYAKDNRLLPQGWDAAAAASQGIHAVGTTGDEDFAGGGDRVEYELPLPDAEGPFTVQATLVHQPLAPRFAAELFTVDTPEVAAFRTLWQAADRTPELVATDTVAVP